MLSYQQLFTPLFIVTAICIFIGGVIGIQLLERLFIGNPNLNSIRMFGITIIINIVILIFLIMSFNKVKFNQGPKGPKGNKGEIGSIGRDGGLNVCGKTYETIEEKKILQKSVDYLDMKPPRLKLD